MRLCGLGFEWLSEQPINLQRCPGFGARTRQNAPGISSWVFTFVFQDSILANQSTTQIQSSPTDSTKRGQKRLSCLSSRRMQIHLDQGTCFPECEGHYAY